MTSEELKTKFMEFCTKYHIHAAEKFTEYSVKLIESLKARYGNYIISDKVFKSEDEIYIPKKIDVKQNENFYYLDEFFFNKIVRNVKQYIETSNSKNKKQALELLEGDYGVYNSEKKLGVHDKVIMETSLEKTNKLVYFYRNGELKKDEEAIKLQEENGFFDIIYINYDDFKNIEKTESDDKIIDMSENKIKTDDKIKELSEKLLEDDLYLTFAHELLHAFQSNYFKYKNESSLVPNINSLSDDFATQQNYRTLPTLQDLFSEIIHEYMVCAAENSNKSIKFIDPKDKNNAFKIENAKCSECLYSINADIAELFELLIGKQTLFYATFENKDELFNDINNKYKNVFYSTAGVMDVYKDILCPKYNIKSKNFWDIMCVLNYFSCCEEYTINTILSKIAIQELLINCLNEKVQEINPLKKSPKILNQQLDYVKNLPAQVKNVLLVKEECNKTDVKMKNVEAYEKLCEECTKKLKFIEKCIVLTKEQQQKEISQ